MSELSLWHARCTIIGMETKSGEKTELDRHAPVIPAKSLGSSRMVFSKSASLWVFFAVIAIALVLLCVVYFQGGLAHVVHQ